MKRRSKGVDSAKAFEDALAPWPEVARYSLQLYISGSTPRSARAIQDIRAICDADLDGRFELEVVDLYQQPERAKPDQIVVTPTLVKSTPLPASRVVGIFSDKRRVLAALNQGRRGGERDHEA